VTGRLYVGTSGFAYPDWAPRFYPAGLPASGLLAHYAGRLPAVELNNTYYASPSASKVATWVAATPPDFRAVAPRFAEPALLANALRAGDARFDFAYAISYGSLLFNRLLSGEPRLLLSSAIVSSSGSAGASPAMRGAVHRREP